MQSYNKSIQPARTREDVQREINEHQHAIDILSREMREFTQQEQK